MKRKKILLINMQFVELYVSGFTNRFIGLWCYVEKNKGNFKEDPSIHWLTNRSLWQKYFGERTPPSNVTVIAANLKFFKYTMRSFYLFYVLYIYYRHRCTSVHLATSIIKSVYLLRLFNFLKIPHCITFASNSIEMAAYQTEGMKKHWKNMFELAANVDVLNPTNSIQAKGKKHISPTSFPYMLEFYEIPAEKFLNTERKNAILFCGSFVQQKNPLLAIEGFDEFLKSNDSIHPDTVLWMIGKGKLLPDVIDHIKIVNDKYAREVVKIVPDTMLIECLASSKVFLSLQDHDNYPSQSVMEAMLFCNSVLSIDNGDTSRLVKPDLGNILIRDKNPQKVGEGIHELLSNWQLNKANHDLIRTEFSAEKFAHYFFNIHQSIST